VCFSEDQNLGVVSGGEGEEVMPFLFGKTIDVQGDGRRCGEGGSGAGKRWAGGEESWVRRMRVFFVVGTEACALFRTRVQDGGLGSEGGGEEEKRERTWSREVAK
jgi:hypothetical protein